MIGFIKTFFPWLVLLSNIFFLVAAVAFAFRKTWGRELIEWLGRHALGLGFLVALAAMAGSLSYSNIVGYTPCLLCWWQRIFIYPQVVLLGIALYKKDYGILRYVLALSVVALLIGAYHVNLQNGGFSVTPCAAVGPSCEKIYGKDFGYITIPFMALSASAYLIGLAVARRFFDKRFA